MSLSLNNLLFGTAIMPDLNLYNIYFLNLNPLSAKKMKFRKFLALMTPFSSFLYADPVPVLKKQEYKHARYFI